MLRMATNFTETKRPSIILIKIKIIEGQRDKESNFKGLFAQDTVAGESTVACTP
jgi:hypothetical protein